MKVTKELVRLFDQEQANHGTETALKNILWLQAGEQLKDLGVKHIKTSYRGKAKA